ncbi:primosomal protein DnaI [Paenibacillus segetis]|jgi:primosomal protein DnaI|uniref:Primosomal protein DnaI n=1 Tax=Paenibacillus segetis TaxID=1325360 RepID=A0ABQ1YQ30_9BACL|nr:primosomal protein DnaI [Paenibacillus segetis]GGH34473.1 primosomal protein DnaI [Paenibacillus segetis]
MESLGQLLSQMKNPQLRRRSEELTAELMNSPLVLQLRSAHPELSDEQLSLNMAKLYQYVNNNRHCSNCPGLDNCPNDFPGHYTKLTVETVGGKPQLIDRQVPCDKQIQRQTELSVKKRIHSFYVDERALEEGYNEVEIMLKDRERAPAVTQVIKYINETKESGLKTRGLYLVGHFGTGKTFLMCYLLHELAKSGYSGVIVYMPEFVEDLKSMMLDNQKLKETVEIMKQADLLIFDDVGAENLNPWVRDHIMGSILNYRMNRKPTFYTSNHSLVALEKHLGFTNKDGEEQHKGQRLMDRIAPFVDVVPVNGSNKRGQ